MPRYVARWVRDPAQCERDLARYRERNPRFFPKLELTPDLSRGEQRLAAEVALAELTGGSVPTSVRERAVEVLGVMARG